MRPGELNLYDERVSDIEVKKDIIVLGKTDVTLSEEYVCDSIASLLPFSFTCAPERSSIQSALILSYRRKIVFSSSNNLGLFKKSFRMACRYRIFSGSVSGLDSTLINLSYRAESGQNTAAHLSMERL